MSVAIGRRPMPKAVVAFAQRWLTLAVCLVAWQFAAESAADPYFPPPLTILDTAAGLWFSGPASSLFLTSTVADDVVPSIVRLLAGWLIASALGIAIGLALGRSKVAMDYFGPLLAFFRAVPPPLLVPVFLVLFNIGPKMQLATIIFGVIWPVLLNAIDGARSVDATKIDTARAFRTTRAQWILGVVVPAALPKIFAGLRVSLAIALILMVISELAGSLGGIGFQLNYAATTFDLPQMWAWICLISVLGYVLNRLLLVIEHRALAWHRGSMRQAEG